MTPRPAGIKCHAMAGIYRRIGVASTFSPRFLAVLAEADRVARRFVGSLSVIHAAGETSEAAARFADAMKLLQREADTPVVWCPGATPVDGILAGCKQAGVELLLAGALEREGDHRNFLGGVARELLRRADCDLLLFPKPEEVETPWKRVVVAVDMKNPSIDMLNRACAIATSMNAEEMIFIGVVTPFDEAIASNRGGEKLNEARLMAIVDQACGFDGMVDTLLMRSTTGFSVCEFVNDSQTSLLIAGAARDQGLRFLPSHVDWLLQVIPTNVLLLAVKPAEETARR